ncbi:hypothetical protein Q7P37_006760 [Cladosporium fusiforme]
MSLARRHAYADANWQPLTNTTHGLSPDLTRETVQYYPKEIRDKFYKLECAKHERKLNRALRELCRKPANERLPTVLLSNGGIHDSDAACTLRAPSPYPWPKTSSHCSVTARLSFVKKSISARVKQTTTAALAKIHGTRKQRS